jgi:hypothetical protein
VCIYFKVRRYVPTGLWRGRRHGILGTVGLGLEDRGWAGAEDSSLTLMRQYQLSHPPAVKWVQ